VTKRSGNDCPQPLAFGQRGHEVVIQVAKTNKDVADALIAKRLDHVIGYFHYGVSSDNVKLIFTDARTS
jgi:hypothetical protein